MATFLQKVTNFCTVVELHELWQLLVFQTRCMIAELGPLF